MIWDITFLGVGSSYLDRTNFSFLSPDPSGVLVISLHNHSNSPEVRNANSILIWPYCQHIEPKKDILVFDNLGDSLFSIEYPTPGTCC